MDLLFTRKYQKVSKIQEINEWKYSDCLGSNYTIRVHLKRVLDFK